jgi:CRP-like cAMP-binding protein
MNVSIEDIVPGREREAHNRRVLQACRPFRLAARSARDAFSQIARPFRAPRRAQLESEGEPALRIYVIGSGRVRVERRVPNDGVVHLAHLGRGDVAGDITLSSAVCHESAVVLEEVRGLTAAIEDVRELAARESGIYLALGAALIDRSRTLEDRLEGLLLRRVEARLAWLLLYFVERWGADEPGGGVMITSTIRHHEIASMIGTGREWVTMTLIRLRDRGILGTAGRRVIVRDIGALRDLAAGKALE